MPETRAILVVEDDADLQEMITRAGEKRSYRMASAGNGLIAKRLLERGEIPDIIVLDINMPGMDGLSFCRWLRDEHPRVPVIFLSARAEEYDKVLALEIGGDDYLTKPFSMKELFTRIMVCLRRIEVFREGSGPSAGAKPVILDGLGIEPERWTCTFRGRDVVLTISEFRILHKLLANPGIVIDREKLAQAAFPDDTYHSGRSVDIHIHRIRQKLQAVEPGFDSIETVYQVGYRWQS
jgi:DNA-binding response OmpR family regulator